MKTHTLSARRRWLAVVSGGFLGAITRYLLSATIQSAVGKAWPYDIFVINLTGAFVLALVTALADSTTLIGPTRRLFINVGFLGAYTTFSSLSLGAFQLINAGKWPLGLLYLVGSLVGGMLAVLLGDWLGQLVVKQGQARAEKRYPLGKNSQPGYEADKVDLEEDVLERS